MITRWSKLCHSEECTTRNESPAAERRRVANLSTYSGSDHPCRIKGEKFPLCLWLPSFRVRVSEFECSLSCSQICKMVRHRSTLLARASVADHASWFLRRVGRGKRMPLDWERLNTPDSTNSLVCPLVESSELESYCFFGHGRPRVSCCCLARSKMHDTFSSRMTLFFPTEYFTVTLSASVSVRMWRDFIY